MLEYEDALGRILAAMPPALAESVPLERAHGRVLLEPVTASVDLPAFDNSSMDGYAVRAADVAAASKDSPVRLQVAGRAAAGEPFAGNVPTGFCVRVFTGSVLPAGADAVVMQEDTRADPSTPNIVWVVEPVRPWENIRLRGEDVKCGATIAETGRALRSGRISLLAACGAVAVKVGRRPTVGLLATGSELREPGQALEPGQIYECNRRGLAVLVEQAGAVPKIFPLVPDTLEATRQALRDAFEQCDLVVTSGGVSVGETDFVKQALSELGGEQQFWRVAIKPGRPFVFGRYGARCLFGLPGNPVSAVVTFLLLVRPALLRWQGAAEVGLPAVPGVLAERLSNLGPRRHFMRVKVDTSGKVMSAGAQASHMLHSLASANGLVDVPPDTTWDIGTAVRVLRFD